MSSRPALLDAKAYPEITFTGQGARRDGDGWVVPGSVTAHGTAVPAEVRLSDARPEAGGARFRATARPGPHQLRSDQEEGHGRAGRLTWSSRRWPGQA